MTPSTSELSAISRLFSSAVFKEMARKGRSPLFARLLRQAGACTGTEVGASVGDVFDRAFEVLRVAGCRDEYVYRAAVTKKILMGKHSLRTASMLNEFRAGSCKADLVILNGTASVYEIKSERDSLARLSNQIENYKAVFATVNVIVGERHVESVRRVVSDDVGILCLSDRYRITVVQDAEDRPERICPRTVFASLRSSEAVNILKALGVDVPAVPNTRLHGVMRELFTQLEPSSLHGEFVQTLKKTRNLASLSTLVDQLPTSLHAAALSVPVRRADHERLVGAVRTSMSAAGAWG